MSAIIVTGTDTGIGKTIFSAGLTQALDATYWKPIQSGLDEETDSQTVARLTGRPTLAEAYRFALPASPHLAAMAEGARIRPEGLAIPNHSGPLIIEGAGGLMVPLDEELLYADQMVAWQAPVILCARTALGTINHTLMSIEVMRARGLNLIGVAYIGPVHGDSPEIITRLGQTRNLGTIPPLEQINAQTLAQAFTGIDLAAIRLALAP